jgi:hypothetical protein
VQRSPASTTSATIWCLLLLLLLLLLQGSSILYAMLATIPEMNDKVSVVAHLGECACCLPILCYGFFGWDGSGRGGA